MMPVRFKDWSVIDAADRKLLGALLRRGLVRSNRTLMPMR
jgi:hypothetical protein